MNINKVKTRANMKNFIRLTFFLFLLITTISVEAKVKLPRLISDGMVLQRDTELKIWGWASLGEKIDVKFLDQSYSAVTNNDGKWEIILSAQKAGGPHKMQVNDLTINDILIGDVWLCSGQSNMELPIHRVLDLYGEEMKVANNPNIRHFKVPLKYDFIEAQEDLDGGAWLAVTPENILDFSAVAYFFAEELYEKYNVPIGLLNSSVGGSPAEAWISKEHLKEFPSYIAMAEQCAVSGYMDEVRNAENKVMYDWYSTLNQKDKGVSKWFKEDINTSDWDTFYLPGFWADQGMGQKNGSFWFRKDFEVPASMIGKPAVLRLGCIIDSDSAYVNGQFVGTVSYQYPPRIYDIPLGLLKEGKNNISIRVINSGGKGGFVEDKPYQIVIDDEYIDLSGEWKYCLGAEMASLASQTFFQYKPTGLYNAMIAPLINYSIKGALWYQGESNIPKYQEYTDLLSTLIQDWRVKWNMPELPFVYAQLPNFWEASENPAQSEWAMFREAQANVLKNPYTGMAVNIDLGEWNDIHPLNKKDVSYRLALSASQVAYGEKDKSLHLPKYESMSLRGNKIVLSFADMGDGFAMGEQLIGFAIAGADKKFVWAKARIEGDRIVVWSDQITSPVAVRYAWADNPQGVNLKNKRGLPVSPFRTDNWEK